MATAPIIPGNEPGMQGPPSAPGTDAKALTGVVRSYNGSKGFGFLTGMGAFGDVMFSRHELPDDAREVRGKFLEGRQVIFDATISQDGRAKATRLAIPDSEGVFLPGIVKSYSEKNGYGFVSSSSVPNEDIRFSKSDFPPLVPGVNMKGDLVIFQKHPQADGKLRVIKIQFQTARIAEKFKCFIGMDGATFGIVPAYQPTLGSGMLTGFVKSFSEKNGYGFIRIPGQPSDIMFGKSDLPGGSISVGVAANFMLALSQDGRVRAKQIMVLPIAPVLAAGKGGAAHLALKGGGGKRTAAPVSLPAATWGNDAQATAGIRVSGAIKSYNAVKGFGFITSPRVTGDVFFMKSNLAPEAQGAALQGRAVDFELLHTPDGNMRAQNITLLGT